MRFLILALLALAAPLCAQTSGVFGNPQVPANNVAQGRTDYTALAFAAVRLSGTASVSFTACTIDEINVSNPVVPADTVRIRLIRDSFPYNLSYETGETVLATVNNPTFPVNFSGFNETLPDVLAPNPWPYFVAIDVAGVGTSTVGHIYQLELTSITQTAVLIASPPITGNEQTIVAPSNAEMDLQRFGTSIAAGAQDDLGQRQAGNLFTLTYTILNTGSDPLILSGNPLVEIIGITMINCNATVTVQPATPVPATTGSTTFQIEVTPTTAGQQFGFGFIVNNSDNDENPYNVVVFGDAVVTVPPATQLVITSQPGNGTAGGTLSAQPIVEARDGSGNLDTNYAANVTAAITSGTGTSGAALIGTVMVAAVGGVAQFTNLGIDLAGTNYTLTVTSGALTQDISDPFDITGGGGGAATQLVITQQPGNGAGGGTLATQPVVEARTAGGALDAGFGGSVTAAITAGSGTTGATLLGTVTVSAPGGVANFGNLGIDLVGTNYTLTFTSGALTPDISSTFDITLGAATQLAITTQPGNAAPGAPFAPQPVVELRDAGGNPMSTDNSSLVSATVASGPVTAVFVGTTVMTVAGGIATFADLGLDTAGTYTVEFTSSIGGVSSVVSATVVVTTGGGGGGGGGGGDGGGGCSTGGTQGWLMLLAALALLAVAVRARKA